MRWALCFTQIVFFCWISETFWPAYDLTINITFDLCMQSTRTVWPTLFGLAPNVFSCAILWKSSISILWEIWISVDAWQTHLMDNARWKKASHKSSLWPYFNNDMLMKYMFGNTPLTQILSCKTNYTEVFRLYI